MTLFISLLIQKFFAHFTQTQNTFQRGRMKRKKAFLELSPQSLLSFRHSVCGLDEGDVVALEHDPADLLLRPVLDVNLAGLVQHQVHVLVEPDDVALHTGVDVLVEPDRDQGSALQVSEDQVDGLDHHLLHFRGALVSHLEPD